MYGYLRRWGLAFRFIGIVYKKYGGFRNGQREWIRGAKRGAKREAKKEGGGGIDM